MNQEVKILWWYCRGCPPLPIPNREVKPLMADGTAYRGRVGSCHIHFRKPQRNVEAFLCVRKNMNYEFRIMNYEFRITNYELRIILFKINDLRIRMPC